MTAVESLLKTWSKVGRDHDVNELAEVSKLCQVVQEFSRDQVVKFVEAAGERPILVSYMADGTPIVTRHSLRQVLDGRKTITRSGKGTDEFYCQAAFYSTFDALGARKVRAMVPDSRPMTCGKSSAAMFSLALDFVLDPRTLGHRGIVVFHSTFDRAPFQSLTRLITQYFTMKCLRGELPMSDDGRSRELLYLLFWVVKTPCAYHDAHKSLEWSMHHEFKSPDLLSEVYIALTSCSNSYRQLTTQLNVWVANILLVCELEDLPDADDLRDLWGVVCVDDHVLEDICDLRLCFRNGMLCVSDLAPVKNLLSRVVYILVSVWRFRPFSSSRWVGVGSSCRTFLGALLTGLSDFVDVVVRDPAQSNYTINGFKKLSQEGFEFVCVAALASYPTDIVLRMLMVDNRVLKTHESLLAEALISVSYLTQLRRFTWQELGSLCGMEGQGLRSRSLHAAHVSVTVMDQRIFTQLDDFPWMLMYGDLDKKLDLLKAYPEEPSEPTAGKIYRLLQMGWNREELKTALRLAAEVPWGTKVVEEIHASGACVRKFHPEIGPEALRVRALVHSVRRMVPTETSEERQERKWERAVGKLEAQRPERCGARQMVLKDVYQAIEKLKTGRS